MKERLMKQLFAVWLGILAMAGGAGVGQAADASHDWSWSFVKAVERYTDVVIAEIAPLSTAPLTFTIPASPNPYIDVYAVFVPNQPMTLDDMQIAGYQVNMTDRDGLGHIAFFSQFWVSPNVNEPYDSYPGNPSLPESAPQVFAAELIYFAPGITAAAPGTYKMLGANINYWDPAENTVGHAGQMLYQKQALNDIVFTVTAVPEPGQGVLFAAGIAMLMLGRLVLQRRSRRSRVS